MRLAFTWKMVWYTTFNDVFWLSVGGMVFGFLAGLAKCKYQRCSCCGIEVDKGEIPEEAAASSAGPTPTISREVSLTDVAISPSTYEPPITRAAGIRG